MVSSSEAVAAQFSSFELDLSSGELIREGRRIRLQGQPFLVLRMLLDHAGEVVTREDLQRQLWPSDTFVDFDHGLNKAIAKLRDALDDSRNDEKLIQTIPRRGYRFTAEVQWVGPKRERERPEEETAGRVHNRTGYWLTGAGLLALLVLLVWLARTSIAGLFHAKPSIRSIAVLPLVNLSNDPQQDYFADGVTEELITDLSYAKPLRVLSRSSTTQFKNTRMPIPQIAAQLDVDAVIEGTVLRTDNAVRVTVRLIAAKPERQLWAASYERNVNDAISLQNQIAAEAIAQIQTQLAPEVRARLSLESRINPEAYDEYLRARFLLEQENAQQNSKAIPHLEKAIQLDPNFAAAYAALGEAWALPWGRRNNREAAAKGLEYSQKAVSLDPDSSEAYASLGHSLMQDHRWNEGEVALRRALDLDSNNPYALEYLAFLLIEKGRVAESLDVSRQLANANPVSPDFQRTYANVLYRAHRFQDSIALCRRIIDLDPNHLATYGTLANSLVEIGKFQEAETAFKTGDLLTPGVQAWLYAREGDSQRARQVLDQNAELTDPHSSVALYILGDREKGLAELSRLSDQWSIKTYHLRNDPLFDPMRRDPRFTQIVKASGLLDD
jgi:TolB-like protein/DNA-binding winged helix-turn-helix (wHTH) protein/Flp pilus assembly protein TadD